MNVLQGPDPVLDWVRGTGLRPVLAALPEDRAADFEAEYARLLRNAYPAGPYGTVSGSGGFSSSPANRDNRQAPPVSPVSRHHS